MGFRDRVNDPWNTMGDARPQGREQRDGADAAEAAIWRMTRHLGRDDAIRKIRQIRDDEAAAYGTGRGGSTDATIDGFVDECNKRLGELS